MTPLHGTIEVFNMCRLHHPGHVPARQVAFRRVGCCHSDLCLESSYQPFAATTGQGLGSSAVLVAIKLSNELDDVTCHQWDH